MNFASLFGPLIQNALYKPLLKAGTWAARQTLGTAQGNAAAPIVNAAAGWASGSLAQVATAHINNDRVAQAVGIPTTEQGLVSAAQAITEGTSTLDVSAQGLLTDFLSKSIIRVPPPTGTK